MKLTAKAIDLAQPADKEYMLSDGDKLYLRVHPSGGKRWMFNYMSVEGRRIKLTLGPYPEISLATARDLAAEQRRLLAMGKDPRIKKLQVRQEAQRQALATFESVAREWHAHATNVHEWSESYSQKILRQLEMHAFPRLGRHPIGTLNQMDVLQCLEAVSLAGTRETAIRLREGLQRVYARAVTLGLLDPGKNFMAKSVADFKLRAPRVKHFATMLDPERIGQLLRDIRGYRGHFTVTCALMIMPYVFQRPGQIRMMEWEQLDLDAGLWVCPPHIMKVREAHKFDNQTPPHVVPLPRQVIEILHRMHKVTGPSGPVFKSVSRRPGKDGYTRYISNNTINSALRALGYDTQQDITGHGFRAMARTLIREQLGWDRELIEKHLAHVSDEEMGDTYDRAQFIEQRHAMAQAWADYLDQLADHKIPPARRFTPLLNPPPRQAVSDSPSMPVRMLS